MKRLDKLNVSAYPWKVEYSKDIDRVISIRDANGKLIVETDGGYYPPERPDAMLMSSAPNLYDALWFQCFGDTGTVNCRNCQGMNMGNCGTCPLGKAREALALASGEKEVKRC